MNKVITITTIAILILSFPSRGQNKIEEGKKYQVGLMTSVTTIFNKPQTVNMENEGAGVGFHGGVAFKYFFLKNNNIGISTGLFFDAENYSIDYRPSNVENLAFYNFEDKEILQFTEHGDDNDTVVLGQRQYQPIYLTLPIGMQFQTNLIGYFKYFGRIGINGSFLLNTKVTDKVNNAKYFEPTGSLKNLVKMNTTKELEFFKSSLFVGVGMNWFFAGNTCLHAEVQYNFGITNVFKGESRSLYRKDLSAYSEKMNQDMLVFKIGVLF